MLLDNLVDSCFDGLLEYVSKRFVLVVRGEDAYEGKFVALRGREPLISAASESE